MAEGTRFKAMDERIARHDEVLIGIQGTLEQILERLSSMEKRQATLEENCIQSIDCQCRSCFDDLLRKDKRGVCEVEDGIHDKIDENVELVLEFSADESRESKEQKMFGESLQRDESDQNSTVISIFGVTPENKQLVVPQNISKMQVLNDLLRGVSIAPFESVRKSNQVQECGDCDFILGHLCTWSWRYMIAKENDNIQRGSPEPQLLVVELIERVVDEVLEISFQGLRVYLLEPSSGYLFENGNYLVERDTKSISKNEVLISLLKVVDVSLAMLVKDANTITLADYVFKSLIQHIVLGYGIVSWEKDHQRDILKENIFFAKELGTALSHLHYQISKLVTQSTITVLNYEVHTRTSLDDFPTLIRGDVINVAGFMRLSESQIHIALNKQIFMLQFGHWHWQFCGCSVLPMILKLAFIHLKPNTN